MTMAAAIVLGATAMSCTSPLLGSSSDAKPTNPNVMQMSNKPQEDRNVSDPASENSSNAAFNHDPRWQAYKMSTFASRPIKWEKDHALDICAGVLGKNYLAAPAAVLFPGGDDEIVVDNSVDEIYHAHVITLEGSKIVRDVVHKVSGKRELKQTVIQLDAEQANPPRRNLLVIVTQAYKNTNPEVETLIPPSLFIVELMPKSDAQSVLSSQRFAYNVKGKDRAPG
jgi:hypothetical protein